MRYPLQAGARELAFDFERGGSAGLVSGRVVLAFFEEIGHFKAQVSGVGGIAQAGLEVYDSGADELLDFAIEMLHAFGRAVAHGIEQRLVPAPDRDGSMRQEVLATAGFHIQQIQIVSSVLTHDRAKKESVSVR